MKTKLKILHLPQFQFLALLAALLAVPQPIWAEGPEAVEKKVIPEIVEPLDVWERIPEEPTTKPQRKANVDESADDAGSFSALNDFFGEEDSDAVEETPGDHSVEQRSAPFKPQRRVKLSKSQLKRIKEARGYLRWVTRRHYVDPRGERELRMCSADLNNYGLKADLDRLLRSKASSRLRSKERAFKQSVAQCGCDLVAVQSVLGRSYASAHAALEKLALKLASEALADTAEQKEAGEGEERLGADSWSAFIGAATGQFAYNGFLLRRNPRVSVIGSWSHDDIALPQQPKFTEERFFRAPYEVLIEVKRQGGEGQKQLRLINFDLRKSLISGKQENEAPRLQMGEALRRLSREAPPPTQDAPPLTYLMGELESPNGSATELVLSGKLPLEAFGDGKPCSLGAKGGYRCTERLYKPQEIFPLAMPEPQVSANRFFSPQNELRYAVQPEKREPLPRSKSAGAKVAAARVSAAISAIGDFAAGSCPFKNGARQGAIFYLDLNW